MTAFYSEALGKHDRSAFTSGNERIDAYFRQTVSQDVKRGYAACYVLVEKASTKLAGFYTLSSHSIPLTELAPDVVRKLPRYPSVPAVLIGWLGRDASFRGRHVGSMLLADAIDDTAAAFYREHQFQPFVSRPNALYLPMKTVLTLVAARKPRMRDRAPCSTTPAFTGAWKTAGPSPCRHPNGLTGGLPVPPPARPRSVGMRTRGLAAGSSAR